MSAATRLARLDDVPVLVDLMSAFYAEGGYTLPRPAAARAFSTILRDARLGRIWLVDDGDRAVGYVVVTVGFSMEYGGLRGFVDDFFVSPAARNRGLGAAALRDIRAACLESGLCALLVETGPSDHPARSLYARAGFVETGRVFLTQALAPPLHEDQSD